LRKKKERVAKELTTPVILRLQERRNHKEGMAGGGVSLKGRFPTIPKFDYRVGGARTGKAPADIGSKPLERHQCR